MQEFSVKVATEEDFDTVYRMALEFVRMSPYALFYSEGRVARVIKDILSNPDRSVILLTDHGMLAGMKVPFTYGLDEQAVELAWWVDEEYRNTGLGKKLIEEFECWAARNGCRFVTMISLDDQVGGYYEKNAYKLCERAYMKDLKPWEIVKDGSN